MGSLWFSYGIGFKLHAKVKTSVPEGSFTLVYGVNTSACSDCFQVTVRGKVCEKSRFCLGTFVNSS